MVDQSIPHSNFDPLLHIESNPNSIYLHPVTENEIRNIIMTIRNTRCDLNTISVNVLKFSRDVLSAPIAWLTNKSIDDGIFSDILKEAFVLSIDKKVCQFDAQNYHHISILSLFSKIIEKCIASRLTSFLDQFSIVSKSHFGFRRGLATEDAIVSATELI